jgi:phosphatidate cytidylyltransferase
VQNLITRTITGITSIILIIGSLILHPGAFSLLVFLIMIAAHLEYFHLIRQKISLPHHLLLLIGSSAIFIMAWFACFSFITPMFLFLAPVVILFIFIAELFRNKPDPLNNIAYTLFPLLYITIPLITVFMLASPMVTGDGPHWQLAFGFMAILWIDDTFAYFTGSLIGRHKLFERISPKKTWEGSIGGALFSLIMAFVLSLFFHQLNTWQWMIGAFIITVFGTLGDLTESQLKRSLQVKDSGHFFPGHGGVLDRIDSGLFAAPAFLSYLILLNL